MPVNANTQYLIYNTYRRENVIKRSLVFEKKSKTNTVETIIDIYSVCFVYRAILKCLNLFIGLFQCHIFFICMQIFYRSWYYSLRNCRHSLYYELQITI